MTLIDLLYALLAYAFGGISFGSMITKHYGVKLTKVGSRGSGATNTGRALAEKIGPAKAKKWEHRTMLLDMAKGLTVVLVARSIGYDTVQSTIGGMIAVVGHCWSPWIGFKGGKGVATTMGVGLAIHPLMAVGCFVLWIIVKKVTKYVSVASMTGVVVFAAVEATFTHDPNMVKLMFAGAAMLIILQHRKNIQRLLDGTEPKTTKATR